MSYVGDSAILLNILYLSTLIFFFVIIALFPINIFLPDKKHAYSASTRKKMLWTIVLLPWILALITVIAITSLLTITGEISSSNALHLHHIDEYDLFSWHTVPIIVFLALLLKAVFLTVLKLMKHRDSLDLLSSFSSSKKEILMDVDSVHAFTSGFLRPKIFISRGLKDKITNVEFTTIYEHERAHQMRRDPLKKLFFSFLLLFFPSTIARILSHEMALSMEQSADEYALWQIGDERLVAKTLIKTARLLSDKKEEHANSAMGVYCAFASQEIQHRIHYIVGNNAGKSFPILFFSASSLSVLIGSLISVEAFHHLIEVLFEH